MTYLLNAGRVACTILSHLRNALPGVFLVLHMLGDETSLVLFFRIKVGLTRQICCSIFVPVIFPPTLFSFNVVLYSSPVSDAEIFYTSRPLRGCFASRLWIEAITAVICVVGRGPIERCCKHFNDKHPCKVADWDNMRRCEAEPYETSYWSLMLNPKCRSSAISTFSRGPAAPHHL